MTEQPLTQAQDHDRRIGRLEGIAEQLASRLDGIDRRLDGIDRRLDAMTRWMVGLQVAGLLAVGSLLVTILLRLP